jgi:hypothetical protein
LEENGAIDAGANLDRHLRGSKPLDLTGLAWERVPEHAVSDAEVRCLTYMLDIESHTMVFLRDLLATRVVEEPELTAFLACWVYDELWHGEALGRFLRAAGVGVERVERARAVRRAQGARGRARHLGMLVGGAAWRDFPTVHMTWGAINELSTLTAYRRLIAATSHPVLADLLQRIVRDERRHYAFYRAEACRRLGERAAARRVTRVALERAWAIVGTGVRPQSETDFVVLHLFGDDDGLAAARAMDAKVQSLPGLDGLCLFERARQRARARNRTRRPSFGSGGMVFQR